MKKRAIFLAFLASISGFKAFSQDDLNALAGKIQQMLLPVQTAASSYEQKLEMIRPGVLKYSFDETNNKKGDRTAYIYEFNLADIDPYAVREETRKDAIYAILAVRGKQKLVKVYKNNEVQSYSEQISIIAKDIDNARSINELMKLAIPLAEKAMEGRLNVSGYDDMSTWLCSNVKDVSLGSKTFGQTLAKGDMPGTFTFKVVESDSKSSTEDIYDLNLADIDINSINYKISGSTFALLLGTRQKAKYIHQQRNSEIRPYVNEIAINVNNVDEARDLKTVLLKILPLAEEKVKADIPVANTEKEGLQRMQSLMGELSVGTKKISQSLTDECYCTFLQTEQDPKSTVSKTYKFNWMDINPNSSSIDVSGDKMSLVLKTNNNEKMAMVFENDQLSGYASELTFYMAGIENSRRAMAIAGNIIEKCKNSYKEPFGNDAMSWIRSKVGDVVLDNVTARQSLEQVDGGKHKFTFREITSKGPGAEETYEFNIADLNAQSIISEVKGKWMYVSVETAYKNKIINYYKDGKIQPYAYKISFAVNDTELARNFIGALKKAIEGVKK